MADEMMVSDPLSPVSRAERRALLAMNVLLAAMVYGGVLPTQINALGLAARDLNPMFLLVIGYVVTAYLAVAFWLYAAADVRAWKNRLSLDEDFHVERVMREVEELMRAKMYQAMRKAAAEEDLPEEALREAAEDVLQQQFNAPDSDFRIKLRKKLLPQLARRDALPYRRRMYFEVYLPPVLTALNLIGTGAFLVFSR